MQILLTGATGFVGSHILSRLIEDGHSVSVIKRSHSDIKRIEHLLGQCTLYNIDEITVGHIFQGQSFDCIIHCATYYGRSDTECLKNIETNLLFPLDLLTVGAARGVRYFINTDSFFTKQINSEKSLDEEHYMHGYTLSKIHFKQWGRMLSKQYGIHFINMQLEHVYGDGDSNSKFIPYIVKACSSNMASVALSEGTQLRDFIHISDVAEAYRAVISQLDRIDASYTSYEVGTGRTRSLREFVGLIHNAIKSTTTLSWGELPMKKGELRESKADITRLKELGWKPKIVDDEDIQNELRGLINITQCSHST